MGHFKPPNRSTFQVLLVSKNLGWFNINLGLHSHLGLLLKLHWMPNFQIYFLCLQQSLQWSLWGQQASCICNDLCLIWLQCRICLTNLNGILLCLCVSMAGYTKMRNVQCRITILYVYCFHLVPRTSHHRGIYDQLFLQLGVFISYVLQYTTCQLAQFH